MAARKINMEALNEEQRKEAVELQERLEKLRAVANPKKVPVPTFKLHTTKTEKTGVIINGMGVPKFFYKSHLWALVGNDEQSEKLRQEIRAFIALNDAELTAKEE